MFRRSLAGLLIVGAASSAQAAVVFENPGNTTGWGRVYAQKMGTTEVVTSPVYKGATAIRTFQKYLTSDGANYHAEVVKTGAQLAEQDLYYGQAIYLPSDWQFHNQNVTFQQWAPEMPEGPWILMFVQGSDLRVGGRGINGLPVLGSITNLRGTWIRVVTRIKMSTAGAFEVWVNGTRTLSLSGDFRAVGPSLRWSSGIYCTRWDTEMPAGQSMLSIFHDSLRIATTLEEADPASWGGMDPPAPDAGVISPDASADASHADARTEPDTGATGTGGASGTAGSSGTGGAGTGRGGTGGSPATGGSGGEPEPEPTPPPRASTKGGCSVGGSGGGCALVLIAFVGLFPRRPRLRRSGRAQR